jgi:hypothetical protein
MHGDSSIDVRLTDTQLGILAALCRPARDGNRFAPPATNLKIAEEVFLSVDAVKAHLRTLYRKFGIEDLPHNQKRARLAELVLEGGYLGEAEGGGEAGGVLAAEPPTGEEGAAAPEPVVPPPDPPRADTAAEAPRQRRYLLLAAAGAVALVVVVVAVLALAGVFSSSGGAAAPSPSTFRAEVRGYCRLALAGEPAASGDRAERARGYLEVIETMRGRLQSLTPPDGADGALERFRAGLGNAANYTSEVAEGPPPAGTSAESRAVAELTFAAGQVQAGALGYGLGHECLAIGDLVASSAQNAAAP